MDAGVIIRKMQHFVIKCCIFLYTYIIGKHGNYLTPEIKNFFFFFLNFKFFSIVKVNSGHSILKAEVTSSIAKVNSVNSIPKAEVTLANPYAEVTLANFTSIVIVNSGNSIPKAEVISVNSSCYSLIFSNTWSLSSWSIPRYRLVIW